MRSIAWPTFGAAAIAYVAGTALFATAPREALGGPAVFWPEVATTLSFLFYALVGAVIVTRGGANRVGWIDGERTACAFSVRMRDATDLPTVAHDLDATVRRAIAPSSVGLWLRGSGR